MAHRFAFFVADANGAGVTALTASVETWRNKSGTAPAQASPTVAELDAVNAPGWYYFDLDPASEILCTIDFGSSAVSVMAPSGAYSGSRRVSFQLNPIDGQLTLARVAALDELTGSNLPADVDTLLTRLSSGRASNLDEITALRLGQLDGSGIPATLAALPAATWTATLPSPPVGTPTTYGGLIHQFQIGEFDPAGVWLAMAECCANIVDNVWSATPGSLAAPPPEGSFGWMVRLLAAVAGKRNVRVNPTAFAGGKLTAATIRAYDTAADAENDVNHWVELTVTANYSGANLDDFLSVGP